MGGMMSTKMTRDEFYEKYGNTEVVFIRYYKYTFSYSANLPDGKRLLVVYGGNGDDIYRHEVSGSMGIKISVLQPNGGALLDGDTEVESFYEY